jgi:hypothetical protein
VGPEITSLEGRGTQIGPMYFVFRFVRAAIENCDGRLTVRQLFLPDFDFAGVAWVACSPRGSWSMAITSRLIRIATISGLTKLRSFPVSSGADNIDQRLMWVRYSPAVTPPSPTSSMHSNVQEQEMGPAYLGQIHSLTSTSSCLVYRQWCATDSCQRVAPFPAVCHAVFAKTINNRSTVDWRPNTRTVK